MDEKYQARPSRAARPVVVGEDLSRTSEDELRERITLLEAEITRTRGVLSERGNIRSAADALFKSENS
ncbi:DUF1192 domain-containing protein [Roseibium polysiphoniae]|uniref:DUF1192 domain-containing protein n=1 Tax=Roseibium polysiphoniae TaxID=2571221 RepID=A0A944GTZ6_9HYPH|nr:DUF1192 domain-containing protein [Roseibium polysiphoniae]MBS8260980.1 DUF1192 domain-containing protein [Roseibium polysiphoniae]